MPAAAPVTSERDALAALASELRTIPILVGGILAFVANRLWEIDRLFDEDVFLPTLWAWWTLLAALFCFAYAARPASRWLLALSGGLATTSMAARAVAVVYRFTEATSDLGDASLHLAGAVYTLAAVLIAIVWLRLLRPACTLLRRHRGFD